MIPGNITAIYAETKTSYAGIPNSSAISGTVGISFNRSFCVFGGETVDLQQAGGLTVLTGATIDTAAANFALGRSGATSTAQALFNVGQVALVVYYTGTAPPANTNLQIVPPLLYGSAFVNGETINWCSLGLIRTSRNIWLGQLFLSFLMPG